MARKTMLTKLSKRGLVIFCIFGVLGVLLVVRLFRMQVVGYEKYQQSVIDNMTVETTEKANRGKMYDTNMNLLATNTTAYRVFISPVDIQSSTYGNFITHCIDRLRYGDVLSASADGEREDVTIAKGLSAILGVDYDSILAKSAKKNRRDETIKTNVDEETADKVRKFIAEYGFEKEIHVSALSLRYYPYDNLASHVIGFTGSDGDGLFGLELYYNELLSGTNGRYITAQDAHGNDMPFDYETYFEANDGLQAIYTIDVNVQFELEKQLEAALEDSGATDRVCGIVMDVNTGAILAMAVKPDFDLNHPYELAEYFMKTLNDSGLKEGSDDYIALKSRLLNQMWNNKCVNALYEPGSTFKVVTSAMCLEEGAVKETDTFYCAGSLVVGGARIHCWKHAGHREETFRQGLSNSCNPVLMTIAAKLGGDLFYHYVDCFGYLEKTGIDLPGESAGIFHAKEAFGPVELAVASFGQRFKTTPIQQLTAIAAVANGGYLVTPHFIKGLLDDNGNTVYTYETEVKRQVVSAASCAIVNDILEDSVANNGGGKNAYVPGYRVAAKTGTSEKLDTADKIEKYIGTTVAYAPANDPQVAILIVVDEPGPEAASIYGSVLAAPYCAKVFEAILPYLGMEPNYTDAELAAMDITLQNYAGYGVDTVKERLNKLGLQYEVIGSGEKVKYTVPGAGATFSKSSGKVLLYTDNEILPKMITVPNVVGKTGSAANQMLINSGFNVEISGARNYTTGAGAVVVSQSVAAGTKAERGSIVRIELRHMDSFD